MVNDLDTKFSLGVELTEKLFSYFEANEENNKSMASVSEIRFLFNMIPDNLNTQL